jgi:hypothetical protein
MACALEWLAFGEGVLAVIARCAPDQMLLDAKWRLECGIRSLRGWVADCRGCAIPGYCGTLEILTAYEILPLTASMALTLVTLSGTRFTWMRGQSRFRDAFMTEAQRSLESAPSPPKTPDRREIIAFLRGLAPRVMGRHLDAPPAIRVARRKARGEPRHAALAKIRAAQKTLSASRASDFDFLSDGED